MSVYKKRKALIYVLKKNAHYYYKFGFGSYGRTMTFFKELIINRF